jgi:hypothetical protein
VLNTLAPEDAVHLIAALCGTDVRDARRRLHTLAAHNLLTETARDAFSRHDLVRLYLRELAQAELSAAEREAVLTRSLRYPGCRRPGTPLTAARRRPAGLHRAAGQRGRPRVRSLR